MESSMVNNNQSEEEIVCEIDFFLSLLFQKAKQ